MKFPSLPRPELNLLFPHQRHLASYFERLPLLFDFAQGLSCEDRPLAFPVLWLHVSFACHMIMAEWASLFGIAQRLFDRLICPFEPLRIAPPHLLISCFPIWPCLFVFWQFVELFVVLIHLSSCFEVNTSVQFTIHCSDNSRLWRRWFLVIFFGLSYGMPSFHQIWIQRLDIWPC